MSNGVCTAASRDVPNIRSDGGDVDGKRVLALAHLRVVRIVAVVAVAGVIRQRVHNGAWNAQLFAAGLCVDCNRIVAAECRRRSAARRSSRRRPPAHARHWSAKPGRTAARRSEHTLHHVIGPCFLLCPLFLPKIFPLLPLSSRASPR